MERRVFKARNSLNKLKTGLKMGQELSGILVNESLNMAKAIKEKRGIGHMKDLPSSLIFRAGLAVSGTKLAERFEFKKNM
jgi:hypothetical protein